MGNNDGEALVGEFILDDLTNFYAVQNMAQAFGDQASFRYVNAVSIQSKLNHIKKKRCLNTRLISVHPKVLLKIIEYSTLEDNDSIQNMWAGLMANSQDPSRLKGKKVLAYIHVLASLDPLDVFMLNSIDLGIKNKNEYSIFADDIEYSSGVTDDEAEESLNNLGRMGLIESGGSAVLNTIKTSSGDILPLTPYSGFNIGEWQAKISITRFGRNFLAACDGK